MSQKIGDNTIWSDLNKDGQRLDKIIKHMDTKQKKETNLNLQFAYIDRLIKATNQKVSLAYKVLEVERLLKLSKKRLGSKNDVDLF